MTGSSESLANALDAAVANLGPLPRGKGPGRMSDRQITEGLRRARRLRAFAFRHAFRRIFAPKPQG